MGGMKLWLVQSTELHLPPCEQETCRAAGTAVVQRANCLYWAGKGTELANVSRLSTDTHDLSFKMSAASGKPQCFFSFKSPSFKIFTPDHPYLPSPVPAPELLPFPTRILPQYLNATKGLLLLPQNHEHNENNQRGHIKFYLTAT